MALLYNNADRSATEMIVVRREIRNILCLFGGSRQEIASQSLKAAVFVDLPRLLPIIRSMKSWRLPFASLRGNKKSLGTVAHRTSGLEGGQPPQGRKHVLSSSS